MWFQRRAALPAGLLTALLVLSHAHAAADNQTGAAPAKAAANPAEPPNRALDLAAYRGQVVYLDFWASWCAPCKKSFNWMRAMQELHGKRGLVVIAVNLDHDAAAAHRFLEKTPAPFSIIYDPEGTLAKAHKVAAMPSSFLYDRAGRQRASHQGFKEADGPGLEAQILELLAESAPDSTSR